MSNQTLLVIVPTINQRIDPRIVATVATPQTIMTPETKEVVADTEFGVVWLNRIPWQVSRTGLDGSTPCGVCNDVSVEHCPSLVLVGIVATCPPCGLSGSLQVVNKCQSTYPGLGGNT